MADITPGEPVHVAHGIVRITAPNPGMMTGPGTNTYIVGTDELIVVDPGPESEAHLQAVLQAVGGRLRWIVCTHTHKDHSPNARMLAQITGASTAGMPPPGDGRQDMTFAPDRVLRDGDVVECRNVRLRAVHTPGHASNHLCYLLEGEKLLFTGDHVMQGSTVVISPPDGDMIAYLASLARLLELDLERLAPGHGHPIDTPHDEARKLVTHRLRRERKVIEGVAHLRSSTLEELVKAVYDDVGPRLHPVAMRSLHAHLIKLEREGRVRDDGGRWAPA